MKNVKEISIKMYLEQSGVRPVARRAGYGMYLSPLRAETTPSFKVDYNLNLWYDFGLECGGSIIDLVMRCCGCGFSEAVRRLERSCVPSSPAPVGLVGQKPQPTTNIQITTVAPLTDPRLLAYLAGRGINTQIATKYCSQVHYNCAGRQYYAIGFATAEGGWELRSEYFKGCVAPKSHTIVRGSSSADCYVVEGFMDMLSLFTLMGRSACNHDVVVLNSVANARKCGEVFGQYNAVYCLLDNDMAGKNTTAHIATLHPKVVDKSHLYHPHKDINDYLRNRSFKARKIATKKSPKLR